VVRARLPITLGTAPGLGGQEPEPDVTVAEGARQRYGTHHPEPSEIRLLVEVSDSSVAIDRTFKSTLYAAAGIERYWIVNLLKLPKEPPLTLLVQDLLP
jgi:Uma2 family endonuclease